jgi:hypothetical protein
MRDQIETDEGEIWSRQSIWSRRCAQIWSRRRESETVCSELVEAASLDVVEAAMCRNGQRGYYGLRVREGDYERERLFPKPQLLQIIIIIIFFFEIVSRRDDFEIVS